MLVWRLMTRARWLAAVLFVAGSLAALGSAYAAETAAEKPLPPAVEASIILHSIAPEAPIYLRVLFPHKPVTADFLEQLIDLLLDGAQ